MLAPFRDDRVAGVRGSYTTIQRALVARFTQLELDEKQERLAASETVAVIDTACAAYRKTVFFRYGGFDERFPATSAEDVEFSFRLAEQGERLVFAPGARVRHIHADKLRPYLWRKARFGFFRAQLYRRYPDRLVEDGYTPRLMPLQIGLAGLMGLLGVVSVWAVRARPLAVGTVLAFVTASVPMVRRARRSDPGLTAFVPLLLLARSLAQAAGLAAGFTWLCADRASGLWCRRPANPLDWRNRVADGQ
jgi:GT2 family glycosyltransferase